MAIFKLNSLSIPVISVTIFTLIACNQPGLSDKEARDLVKKALDLPQPYTVDNAFTMMNRVLENNGFITTDHQNKQFAIDETEITEKGRQYYIGKNPSGYLMFKTNDFDFDAISGVIINEDSQSATIMFTIKAINITPIAESLKKIGEGRALPFSTEHPINCELIFRKFNNRWELQPEQNVGSKELLRQLLYSN
jgi:hypothetical protein